MARSTDLPLDALIGAAPFTTRHIGPAEPDQAKMLAALGLSSLGELIDQVVPAPIRNTTPLALPPARSEADALDALRTLASRKDRKSVV